MLTVAKTKINVMPASRILSAISLGVFCRTAPSTSAIMRSRKVEPCAAVIRTLSQSDVTRVPPVAAALADNRSRFTGNRRFIDRGDTLDHFAIAGDKIPRLDEHKLSRLESGCIDELEIVRVGCLQALRLGLGPSPAQRIGLSLAAPLCDGLGEISEEHGKPQPDRDL